MAKLKYLVIHCTDTPANRPVSAKDIYQWHIVERGWSKMGYSDMIHLDGSLENLTPFDQDDDKEGFELTNGAKGINGVSHHIVYVGGKGGDTRTRSQKGSLEDYVRYMILRHPDIQVAGHNQFSTKDCPSFDVPEWLRELCIHEKNIYDG